MKTDSLTLSPETASETLPDCQPGEVKTITLTIKVTANDESGLAADVSDVNYSEGLGTEDSGSGNDDDESSGEMSAEAKPKMRRPAAVIAVLGKK